MVVYHAVVYHIICRAPWESSPQRFRRSRWASGKYGQSLALDLSCSLCCLDMEDMLFSSGALPPTKSPLEDLSREHHSRATSCMMHTGACSTPVMRRLPGCQRVWLTPLLRFEGWNPRSIGNFQEIELGDSKPADPQCAGHRTRTRQTLEKLGGITCLTLLVCCGLICLMRVSLCQGSPTLAIVFATFADNQRWTSSVRQGGGPAQSRNQEQMFTFSTYCMQRIHRAKEALVYQ